MEKTTSISAGAKKAQGFDDYQGYAEQRLRFPTKIVMRCGEAIDYIGLCYGSHCLPGHGYCEGGAYYEFPLYDNEHITKISGLKCHYWNNEFLFSLKFHTDKGRSLGVDNNFNGIEHGTPFEITFKDNHALACLFGEIAPPQEQDTSHADTPLRFLAGIGAYQAAINMSVSDLNDRESVVLVLRDESPDDVFPVFDDFPFVNLYYNNGNGEARCREYYNSLEVPSSKNGEEYRAFGEYGALYYASKYLSGSKYVGVVHYSGLLNLMFDPYLILPGETNFFQMGNARISHFNLAQEENVYQRLGYTEENIRRLFEDSDTAIFASAPVSSVYIGGLSPLEAMMKLYSTMPETYLHDIGNFISGLSCHKSLNKENWEEFLGMTNIDFLYLGNVRLMTSACFQDFTNLVYNVLKKVKEKYFSQIDRIPKQNPEASIYETIGDLLAAFYILVVTNKEDASDAFWSYLLPTAGYVTNEDSQIDSHVGFKAFLDDVYHVHNGFFPVFVFKNKEGKKKAATLDSDFSNLHKSGYRFSGLVGYYPEGIVSNAERIFGSEGILELACTYGTFNRGTLIPLFRLYHPTVWDSFLTFDLNEIIEARKLGYEYEDCLGYVVAPDIKDSTGLKPIYRAHNSGLFDHLFTESQQEIDSATSLGYSPENITGYECGVDMAVKDGTCRYYRIKKRLVFRYYSIGHVDHRYTLSDAKSSRELEYNPEGGSFFVAALTYGEGREN